ncbi:MAG: hypothetical protein WBP72_07350 [Rhodocyclaceae bacterium]
MTESSWREAQLPLQDVPPGPAHSGRAPDAGGKRVRHFRQILLWPLQLMPIRPDAQLQKHWELLQLAGPDNPWRELAGEFTGDPARFEERHYNEFVTFLPQVQRFLYGEGMEQGNHAWLAESPIRVFRRNDIAGARVSYGDGLPPVDFGVAHVDLYFFYDIDVVLLAVEVHASDLTLECVQDTLYRFGRTYPLHWDGLGRASHCLEKVEWLSAAGHTLACSDFERRDKYLAFVREHRSPCIASHWEFLLRPLVHHHSGEQGPIRYRQIEYHRLPVAAYLALDDPRALSQAEFVRLSLATAPGSDESLPQADRGRRYAEARHFYDRYWSPDSGGPSTRFMCSGHALVVVGSHNDPQFADFETGVLGEFRHQYFLLFLIAHFHKAALLMLSERLVAVLGTLDIDNGESTKQFKRATRRIFEIFLRFTHRYWFHEVSDQVGPRELFRMCSDHLGADRLYAEVREEIEDMINYLDSDSLRRQSNTVVRLTVVTTFGLIASVTTGFLGMNLIAAADSPPSEKLAYFFAVLIPAAFLTFYAVLRSRRLSDFMEALSDDRLPPRAKLSALARVWRRRGESSV